MKKLINIILVLVISGFVSTSYAATIKWSMPGDSLTLDPHAQNEGPTHMVSRQVYEGSNSRYKHGNTSSTCRIMGCN